MAASWIFGTVLLLFLFIVATVVVGILLATENGVFCPQPGTELISSTSGTMRVFNDTSLYPYNGNWDNTQLGKTVEECMEICLNNASCQGFHRHDEDGLPIDQGTCYLYYNNNVKAMLGSDVNVDSFFTQDKLVVGHQLPLNSTNVYIKTNTPYTLFRSAYDQPTTAT